MQGRCRGERKEDAGEMQGRCRGERKEDAGEMQGRCRADGVRDERTGKAMIGSEIKTRGLRVVSSG